MVFQELWVVIIISTLVNADLLKLNVMKIKGTFKDFPSIFLSKGTLEVMEGRTDSEIILCDVFPVPVTKSEYLGPKQTVKDYCNRDGGIFDNLPYSWINKTAKKKLFDLCSFELYNKCLSGASTAEEALSEGLKSVMNVEIISLTIEVADQRAKKKLSLGAAVVVAKIGTSNDLDFGDSLSRIPSSDKISSEDSVCVVNCHVDELVALALMLNKPILVDNELFDLASTDALLLKGDSGTADDLIIKCPTRDITETNEFRVDDDDAASPAWEIFNPAEFLGMSNVEKRAVLRASGITSLPRPREGARALDNLLTDLMDDAVRAEYFRLVASRDAAKSKSGALKSSADPDFGFESKSKNGNSRQELLRKMGEALEIGDLATAEKLRERFAVETVKLADPTQPKGSYDRFLDQDDWYFEARRKAMAPKKADNS